MSRRVLAGCIPDALQPSTIASGGTTSTRTCQRGLRTGVAQGPEALGKGNDGTHEGVLAGRGLGVKVRQNKEDGGRRNKTQRDRKN